MKQPLRLRGVFTALITPMQASGTIDWAALDALVDGQLAAGVAGVVVNGTTGEATTLTRSERHALLRRVVQRVGQRALVLAGAGASSTAATIEEQQAAEALGADASLVVTPPYNRPSDAGLLAHYDAVAASSALPIVLYNVPSRTGRDMSVALLAQLARRPTIVGVKDANALVHRAAALRAAIAADAEACGPFFLLSGDDASAAAYCAVGGDGLVSVASNAAPSALVACIDAALTGQREALLALQARLTPFLCALETEGNPVPIKAACAALIGSQAHYRLPLLAMGPEATERVASAASALLQRAAPSP